MYNFSYFKYNCLCSTISLTLIYVFFIFLSPKITAMLRNEVGWFDEEENSADTLSMRLANDATFVRATFSNRLSIFIQDSAAVIVALLIGLLLQWRLALVALATLPVLTVSAVAQVCMLYFVVKFFRFPNYFPKVRASQTLK